VAAGNVLVWDGTRIDASNATDLIAAALESGATTVAVPVERLDPAFFDLSTGVAGELVQKAVNYRLGFAVVGSLPVSATSSTSFMAFVREANRGTQVRFVDSVESLSV